MAQPTVPLYLRIDPDLAAKLDEQCEREHSSKVEVVRKALEKYFEEAK